MINTLKPLATIALIAMGGAAFAQDAEPATDDAAATAETNSEATAEPTVPQPGQVYIKETSGDWEVRCMKAEEGNTDDCQIYQLLTDGDDNAVSEVKMFPLPEGNEVVAGAVIVVPLMTLIPEGVTLTVDGGQPQRYPFEFCNQAGCVSRIGLRAEELNSLKRGNKGTVRLVPAGASEGDEVLLDMSLTGFTAGFEQATAPR
ncbi:invasion associated locus B family protein [Marivivens donghaensis]|uniref:Invasion associated locus B family protein n=1 Tax=Marivivens donghaensis TaxID=1699413 RepID=A0ABX0VZ74_9RHOB|nr:invasion associated locus B family protein [Marivivens donghaensis]NIY73385.1 invasion associated locus B family protein [Marivivens donghaensis]